jgi:asparagine synthase (glutamine-hydrolysing)
MLANAGRDTAFCVVNRGCEVEFHLFSTHIGRSPPLLSFFQAEDATCVFLGQLYYRCELLAELGSSSFTGADPRTASNDAELAIAMYRQCGIGGLERLEGDFALVIWDVRESRLVAIRDPMGGHPYSGPTLPEPSY